MAASPHRAQALDAGGERTMLAAAAQGDEAAVRAVIAAHEGTVARVITAMLGAGDDADDVGQETFVRFLSALPRFRGDASVRTYLTRIAMNLCLDHLAKRRRRRHWLRFGDAEAERAIPPAPAAPTLESREEFALVRAAVSHLDDKHRAVVVLRLLEEHSTRDTAMLLGIPDGTVMSRLTRALDKLRTALSPVLDR